jgi:hypothetical protein
MSAIGIANKKNNEGKFNITRMRTPHPKPKIDPIYQLDLVTPGIKPCEASSRNVRREYAAQHIFSPLRACGRCD